jgi:O-glycosyl hydrolase
MTSHFYRGGTPQYFEAIMGDEKAREHFDVAATHGYEDGFKAEMKASSSAQLREFISQWDLPLWMTEGGTGGHEWPKPLEKGVAGAIHNSLVAGHCSAFVPWQITGKNPSSHNLMVMNKPTHKTYAAMHYFKFIPQDSVRIGAEPGFGEVKASAYVDPKTRRLSIVLLNPTQQAHPVRLALKNIPAPDGFTHYRTSAEEALEKQNPVAVENGVAALQMPAESIVTLTTIVPAE